MEKEVHVLMPTKYEDARHANSSAATENGNIHYAGSETGMVTEDRKRRARGAQSMAGQMAHMRALKTFAAVRRKGMIGHVI